MIFLSIINHDHDHMIINNKDLESLATNYPVIIKSNTPASKELLIFTKKHSITLLNEKYSLGFGENNNYIFNYLIDNNLILEQDHFLVINPDVNITLESMHKLTNEIKNHNSDIYTINLFSDKACRKPEHSIKKFPKKMDPILGFITRKRSDAYDKSRIHSPIYIDWAAGSFLLFNKKSYEQLEGFSEKFFMYFEDVDICRRALENKMLITYLPDIKAVHIGAFNNRNIFSQHFIWYLKSYFRYHFRRD